MALHRALSPALLLAFAVACISQTATTLQLGGSYDSLQFEGLSSQQIALNLSDCAAGVCQLQGSGYGVGALQSSGHYSLVTGTGAALTLTSQGAGAEAVSAPNPWWFLYQTSTESLVGEVQFVQARDSPSTGQLTLTGVVSGLGGSLGSSLGGSAAITLVLYDGAGLQALVGNSNTATGSVAAGSELVPGSGTGSNGSGTSATPVALDAYGSLSGVTVASGTGYFQVAKMGTRWIFVDPDGHPFWMLGVFDVDFSADPNPAPVLAKYGGSEFTWGLQTVRRLRSWGFNATAEFSSGYVVPVNQYGSYETTEPMPWVATMRPSYYSLINYGDYAAHPVKDLVNGLDSVYTNYRGGTLPDIFDPNFAAYTNGFVAANTSPAMNNSPWLIGTATDNLDDLWGFGSGPDQPSVVSGHESSNIGWLVLCTNFAQSSNSVMHQTYSDTEVYTKYALANWLQSKYLSITALNSAWGSTYTTFGDAGGYGTGTGLLDEDGRDAWVGNDDVALSTAHPQVAADLNAFLGVYARQYFSTVTATIRKYLPNHLVFGPCTLNNWNGITRAPILAAAAEYTDVIQANMANQAVYDASLKAVGDHPFVTWTGMPANPDSDLSAFPNSFNAEGSFTSQSARGAAYAAQVEGDFAWTGSNAAGSLAGSQNVVGSKFWAWTDSWGEHNNWGLVTFLDNPYDGISDVKAAGTDAWGYPTGGEAANYGNFLGPATAANQLVLQQLLAALAP